LNKKEWLIWKCRLGVNDDKKGSLIFYINVCNGRLETLRISFSLGLQRNGLCHPVKRNMRLETLNNSKHKDGSNNCGEDCVELEREKFFYYKV
jgi:hypothetical protein